MGLPEGRDIYIDHEENDKPYVMKNSHIPRLLRNLLSYGRHKKIFH